MTTNLQICITTDGAHIIDLDSDKVLQEDFNHSRMRCPTCNRTVNVHDIQGLIQQAQRELSLLQATIDEACVCAGTK